MNERAVPWLVFDGDCGFCTTSATWVAARLHRPQGPNAEVRPWQFTDLPAVGTTSERAQQEVLWVPVSGDVLGGAAAFAAWLRFRGGAYAVVGHAMTLPGVRSVAAAGYRVVARNRHRLPGGTPACALPPPASGGDGAVTGLRDYDEWHRQYDDPESSLSWRLRRVRAELTAALDRTAGPVRVLSACAGDGRDVIEVLRDRTDRDRVTAALVELHPGIARRARDAAAAAGLAGVQVRERDAGLSDAYAGVAPADVVLLVGVLGNITDDDLWRLVAVSPQLCAPGATLIWSRGLDGSDRNDQVRARYAAAGFTELGYETSGEQDGAAFGVVRYDGPPVPLEPGRRIFTFIR